MIASIISIDMLCNLNLALGSGASGGRTHMLMRLVYFSLINLAFFGIIPYRHSADSRKVVCRNYHIVKYSIRGKQTKNTFVKRVPDDSKCIVLAIQVKLAVCDLQQH